MTAVITIEKLKIYNRYLGDVDAYARSARGSEKAVFGDDADKAWGIMMRMHADMEMIGNGLASEGFTRKTLEELKEVCDEESFVMLTGRFDFFRHFQTVANILTVINGKISDATDTAWTVYDNPRQLKEEILKDLDNMQHCNFETLEKVRMHFLPTATYQELAVSNGWSDEYMRLAAQFDQAYALIIAKQKKPATDSPINYELYKQFAEASEALINLARGMTWNNFSNDYTYILSEIKDSDKDGMKSRKDMIAENKKKKPVSLEELLPALENIYDNVYDFNLYVYKATKETTVIDIRFYPKMSLDPEFRKTVQDNTPMMHCKVPIPWWRSNDKIQFDIHWEHHVVMPWWKRVFKLKK